MQTKICLAVGGISVTGSAVIGGNYYFSSKSIPIREALKNARLISSLFGDSKTKQGEEEFESDKENIKKI